MGIGIGLGRSYIICLIGNCRSEKLKAKMRVHIYSRLQYRSEREYCEEVSELNWQDGLSTPPETPFQSDSDT